MRVIDEVKNYMNKNYKIKMENVIGDYYLCLGAFYNCVELYNKKDSFVINASDSEEIKKIKQAQIDDLMSNLGKVGEKALKYIIALKKIKVAPNEDLKSLEAVYRGDNAMKYFAKQLGLTLDNEDIQEILNYRDFNNQKSHNFDYLFLVIEKLMPEQSRKIKNFILYDIQSTLMKESVIKGEFDDTLNFIKAIIFPKFSIEAGFSDEEEELVSSKHRMNKKDYDVYRKIIKQSGDIFTRLRYYSNNPKDENFNLDDIFKIINYFVQYIKMIHNNDNNLDFDLDEYFAKVHALNNASLLGLSEDEIRYIFALNVDLRIKDELLFQEKRFRDLREKPYSYKMLEKLIELNLSVDDICEIMTYNLAPRFVEFCLLNGVDKIHEMNDLYWQYIEGQSIESLFVKKK